MQGNGEAQEIVAIERGKASIRDLHAWKAVLRGNFLVLLVTWIIWRFSMRLTQPYRAPFIIKVLGGSPAILGLISAVGSIVRFIVFIPGGYIADKWGRRKIISAMTFFMAFSYLFYVFAIDWTWALMSSVIAASAVVYLPALRAMTSDSLPPQYRGLGFTIQNYLPSISAILSPTLGAMLIEAYGYDFGVRLAFALQFGSGLAAATLRTLFLKETLKRSEVTGGLSDSISELIGAVKRVPRQVWYVILGLFMSRIGEVVGQYRILYYTEVKHLSTLSWGVILSASSAISIAVGMLIGPLVDKYGRRITSIILSIVFIAGSLQFIYASDFTSFLIAMAIITTTRSAVAIGLRALQADLTPRTLRGRINAIGLMLHQFLLTPISYLIGIGYELNPAIPFIFDTSIALVTLALLILFIREPEKAYY